MDLEHNEIEQMKYDRLAKSEQARFVLEAMRTGAHFYEWRDRPCVWIYVKDENKTRLNVRDIHLILCVSKAIVGVDYKGYHPTKYILTDLGRWLIDNPDEIPSFITDHDGNAHEVINRLRDELRLLKAQLSVSL